MPLLRLCLSKVECFDFELMNLNLSYIHLKEQLFLSLFTKHICLLKLF
jgi:hypothetical protein